MDLHTLKNKAWLRRAYVDRKLSTLSVSKLLHCSEGIVYYRLLKAGIRIRSRVESQAIANKRGKKPRKFRCSKLEDAALLRRMHTVEGKSLAEIARKLNCRHFSVGIALKRHGIPQRKFISNKLSPDSRLNNRALLFNLYVTKGLSSSKIGHRFGCSHTSVLQGLRRTSTQIRKKGERA
jgi:hypothetical protein